MNILQEELDGSRVKDNTSELWFIRKGMKVGVWLITKIIVKSFTSFYKCFCSFVNCVETSVRLGEISILAIQF